MRRLLLKTSVVIASVLLTLLAAEVAPRVFLKLGGGDINAFRPTSVYNERPTEQARFVSPGRAKALGAWPRRCGRR